MRAKPDHSGNRRGFLALEALIVLPIVGCFFLALCSVAGLEMAWQQMLTASREGARVAALGGTADEVEAATRLFLGGGTVSQSEIQVFITGDDGFPALPGQPVSVVISIPAARVMPQFGAMIGFAFGENQLVARTTMRKE